MPAPGQASQPARQGPSFVTLARLAALAIAGLALAYLFFADKPVK